MAYLGGHGKGTLPRNFLGRGAGSLEILKLSGQALHSSNFRSVTGAQPGPHQVLNMDPFS